MAENKRFDFEDEYITLDGGVFATTKNRQNAELISKTLNQLYEESEELKKIISTLKDIIYRDEMIIIWEYSTNMDDEEELEAAYNSEDITELIKFCKR